MKRNLKTLGAALIALFVLTSAAGAAVSTINFGADAAQNPQLTTDVTKTTHEVGWAPTTYEDNTGAEAELAAEVNESVDNPATLTATDITVDDFAEFPRKDDEVENSASALDASEWSVDDSSSDGTATVTDVSTAPDVTAVEIATDGQTTGPAVFTYSNFSITSDAEKRYVQLAADIETLDSGVDATMRLNDADGDYVEVTLANASADPSTESVLANTTGEGAILQTQVGQLTVEGTGDGVIDEIQSLEVRITDADASLEFSLINAEKMGEYQFGTQRYDSDDDGELDDTRVITDHAGGAYDITSVDSLGSAFEDATVHGVTYPMLFKAEHVSAENVNVSFDAADSYPAYDYISDQYYRLELPDAYDLSYANAELLDDVSMPGERYQTVEYAEGVSDTDFADIESWTSVSGDYGTLGDTVSLDQTIQPGQTYAYHAELVVTEDERGAIEDVSAAAGQFSEDNGGILDMVFSLPGMIVGGLLGFLGLRSRLG